MRATRRALVTVTVALAIFFAIRKAVQHHMRQPLPGTHARQLVVGGVTRTYLLRASGAARPGRPLVLVLHGYGGSPGGIERRTRGRFDQLADREGAVVAYPEALGDRPRWNDGWFEHAPGAVLPDDLAFLSALIDALAADLRIDRKRVFAAGFSNGASMVYRLACQRPDLVAAVAPVSGGMPPDVARACARGAPVAIIGMHGTGDAVVRLDQSIRDGISTWAARDGCPPRPASSALADADPTDGTQTHADLYQPCAAGTAVAFYTIEGGGHAWPGGESRLGWVNHGNMSRDFDAGVLIWGYFQQHGRR